ncbi:MAG: amidohydrolase family protein [Planctomycetota bacterium]
MRSCHRLIVLVALLLPSASAFAQSRQVPAPEQQSPVILYNASIHPVTTASIDNGYIAFDNGRITGMGSGRPASVAPGTTEIDLEGMHVYPGLIAAQTRLGLVETSAVDVTNDHNELGDVTPEVRAAVAINPDTDLIPVARANGILVAMTLPTGGTVIGRSAIIRMDGWTWEDMCIAAEAGLVMNWPSVQPRTARWITKSADEQRKDIAKNLDRIDKLFDVAEAYVAAHEHDPSMKTDLRFEAMRPILAGEQPLFVWAATAAQIESAISWSIKRGYQIVIVGGYGADEAIASLKTHDVPVIINGTHRLPARRDDAYDRPFTLPSVLEEAGIRYCIAPGSGAGSERNLNHHAATAVQYGLSREDAIKAITIDAATVLGIDEMYGSLAAGKSATLIVTDGDPLEMTMQVKHAFIDGRKIDLSSRQTEMYEKYREKYRQRGLIDN